MSASITGLIRWGLARLGLQIQRLPSGKPSPIHPWDDEDCFGDLIRQISGYTVVDRVRCFMLYQHARHAMNIPGDVAEIGVFRGGTARLLAKAFESTSKTVHLFDTFSGMPPTDPDRDLHQEGDFSATSLGSVQDYLHDCPNVRFYQGFFPYTAASVEDLTFCMVHIDTDIYKSVMDCCAFFYPRMRTGGIMILDDYGFLSCPGAKMAVDEFFSDKPESPFYLPTGQCFVIRL